MSVSSHKGKYSKRKREFLKSAWRLDRLAISHQNNWPFWALIISRRESWTYSISTCCGRCLLDHLRTIRASKNGSCGWRSWRCVYRPYLARKNFHAPDATKLTSSQSDCMQLRNHWTWAMVQRSRYSSTDTRYGSIENAERVPTFALPFHDMYLVAAPSLSGNSTAWQ